ncbi:MAG TPA: phytoene/squalene synthase family protein [Micropepsaceae bacterium]|nr:phytoene/squalene synthase family protein [Micropepsaceae bacterium]
MTDAAASHERTVRKTDYDRYLAAMFAPAAVHPHLFALYAFNYEVAKIAESVREPIAGHIRLQWWREAVAEAYAGRARAHPVVVSLKELIAAHRPPQALFEQLIEARESDLEETPFADMAALMTYADATSGHLMRLAARVLGAEESLDDLAESAGIAYALIGLLRALPFHVSQKRLMLPLSALRQAEISPDEIFANGAADRLPRLIGLIAEEAREKLAAARRQVPRRLLPALLPAALLPAYLRVITAKGFEPFRNASDVPPHRRQLAMIAALLRGHL